MNLREGAILNIDKPYGWSSTDVVRKLKVALRQAGYPRTIKIGHAGTLDPLATGVLLICIGRATKQVNELQAQPKEYLFKVTLGATTPSFDLEHPVDQNYPYEHITKEAIESYLSTTLGEQDQVPPLYSAKKIDGRRAYEYARGDEKVELRSARITIYSAELVDYQAPHAELKVECSKGTYVRSIARDMGVELASGGYLSTLRRTKSGGYQASQGWSIEQAAEYIAQNPNPENPKQEKKERAGETI
ncbi:MAG: tRNA pseudouridine(55) synthase TruB [Rikenellaceae bacterium]